MPNSFRASPGDVSFVLLVGVAAIGFAVTRLVKRLIEVVPNKDVPVEVAPEDQTAQLPLGPGGELVGVGAENVIVTVSDLPLATYIGVLGVSVVGPAMVIVVAVLGIGLSRAFARGDVFIPENTRRVNAIAATVLAWAVCRDVFTTFQHNGVLAVLAAPEESTGGGIHFDYGPLAIGVAIGVFALAFTAGEKLQRDTEGLV